jgi:Lon protease-like protein
MQVPPVTQVPLFPLPGHVLLPGLPVPFHVFEPRYRALVDDLMRRPAAERLLAVPRIQPGHEGEAAAAPPLCPVVSLARLVSAAPLPDGRWLIAVMGDGRWRLGEEPSSRPYRQARLDPLPELPAPADLRGRLDLVAQRVLGRRAGLPDDLRGLLDPTAHPPGVVLDRIGALTLVDPDLRQRFLEATSPVCRLRILAGSECSSSGRLAVALN